MNESRSYQRPFFALLAVTAVLVVMVAALFWQRPKKEPQKSGPDVFASTASDEPDKQQNRPTSGTEPAAAPVQLTPQRMQAIGVKLGTVERKQMQDVIRVTGNVDADERRISYIQVRFPGWIRTVFVNATYQFVRKGQPLFTIYSPDLVTTEQEYLLARKSEQQLAKSSVQNVASGAASLAASARERLEQWEVPESEIAKLEATGKVITDLTFKSPVSGYVTEKKVLPNMYVQPETQLYTVADLSTLWVYAQVFQTDLARIKPGDPAIITVDTYPGKEFRGRVDQILPQVDMNTRTARVRLVIPNPGLKLTPGMFVNVELKVPMGRNLVVPASAVFHSGTRNLVFVSQGEGKLQPRYVELGQRVGDDFIVTSGLKQGEPIVTSANFLIDSESQLQAAAGGFVPPPPGAGGAAAMQPPSGAAQASAELATDPSPPRKGDNVFRVKVVDSKGSPVTGGQVNVTFFMAAMPSMGMAAMRTSVDLAEKGGGLYEGTGKLDSGGTWQVTVTVRKDGQTLAVKRQNVNAEGGM